MNPMLPDGARVMAETLADSYVIETVLGRGGQGEVYRVRREAGGPPLALKWYYEQIAVAEQRAALRDLIATGSPDPRFLWPIDLARVPGHPSFGYLMPLRPDGYVGLGELIGDRRRDLTFRDLATLGLHIAETFVRLHMSGYCYRDISFGNVLFSPTTASILVCDPDGIGPNETRSFAPRGTARFMAPEVSSGAALPNTDTDRHALAVLLFYVLVAQDPFAGEPIGPDRRFLFDPDDQYWPIYPQFVRRLFTRTFTEGLHQPARRVTAGEWRAAMGRLRDIVIVCQACGRQSFFDPVHRGDSRCWACDAVIVVPPLLEVNGDLVMLNAGTKLLPHHITTAAYDDATVVGEVAHDPADTDRWGLRNLGPAPWQAVLPDGTTITVPTGKALPLVAETVIDFGAAVGTIRTDAGIADLARRYS